MLTLPHTSLSLKTAKPWPIAAMVRGRSREDMAELLPRLFNLCRTAQSLAVRLALDLPAVDDVEDLRREMIRDHVLRLSTLLPQRLGLSPSDLPVHWQSDRKLLRQKLFGPSGALPTHPSDFKTYLSSGTGVASLWLKLSELIKATEAVSDRLPFVSDQTALDPKARVENSCAMRVADHPVVASLDREGRGPLWRLVARCYDLEALLTDAPLHARRLGQGVAQAPATRGLYTLKALHDGQQVTELLRVTPTDHLQAAGGVLEQTLSTLPVTKAGLAPLIIDILDPCSPITVEGGSDA